LARTLVAPTRRDSNVMALPDLEHHPDALRLVKRPIEVQVSFAESDSLIETLEGHVRCQAGDAILTGVEGERWPVERSQFLDAYAPVPPTVSGEGGTYIKRPQIVLALCLAEPRLVPVGWQSDPLHAKPGDWLLRYSDGSHGVIQDRILRATYSAATGETRWPP
jgi:hypothetical protein